MKQILLVIGANLLISGLSGIALIDIDLKLRYSLGIRNGTQNVMVSFTDNINTVFHHINGINFSNSWEKRTAQTIAQQKFTNKSQKSLKTLLDIMAVKYQSFWISNKMYVPNADSDLVKSMATISGVAKIEKEPVAKPATFLKPQLVPSAPHNLTRATQQSNIEWGVSKIRADQVWRSYTGRGVVVAGIDSGVRYTHEALRNNWRSNYGWFDPDSRSQLPNDQDGHGTHTMGTIAGQTGTGVAPEATWIACKGCSLQNCGNAVLLACAQWVQCPTLPDGGSQNCKMGAQVVSNSWTSNLGGLSWFNDALNSWYNVGIIAVYSLGNDGPNCNTVRYPADQLRVIGVGNVDIKERIAGTSSQGPANDRRIKPDISAPGFDITSAWFTGDTDYITASGTSMSCPHVAGVVILMRQRRPRASFENIYRAITSVAVNTLDRNSARFCGGVSPYTIPNNAFGWGRIDAYNSVNII